MSHACQGFWTCYKTITIHHVFLTFGKVQNPLRMLRKATSERPKVLRPPSVFARLTSKCALRFTGVHFFDISTSKSGPSMFCTFWLFDLEMCFAPQRRTLFRALASLLSDPPEPQIIGKTQCFSTFLAFCAPASSVFWFFIFPDLLSSLLWLFAPLLFICPYSRKFDF